MATSLVEPQQATKVTQYDGKFDFFVAPTTTVEWKLDPAFTQKIARGGLGFQLYDGNTYLGGKSQTFVTQPGSITVNGLAK